MPRKINEYPFWLVFVAMLFVVAFSGCHSGSTANEPVPAPPATETSASHAAQPLAPQTGKQASLPPDIDTATLEMLGELRDHWTKTKDSNVKPQPSRLERKLHQ